MATISGINSNSINSISGLNVQAITKVSGQLASVFFSGPSLLEGRLWAYQDLVSLSPQPFNTIDDPCMQIPGPLATVIANPVYFDAATGQVYDDPSASNKHTPSSPSNGYYGFQANQTGQKFSTYFDVMSSSWTGDFTTCP